MHTLARRWFVPAALAVAVAAGASATTPQPPPPSAVAGAAQPAIAATVAMTMQQGHYEKKKIDDTVSAMWFDDYLDRLDYGKLYFLQSDVDEFSKYRTRLDDDVNAPSPRLEAAYAMHDRLLQRMRERLRTIDQVLSADQFDFSDPNAKVDVDHHDATWAKSPAELDAVWQARIAEQVLRMKLSKDATDPIDRLRKRYARMVADQESLDAQDVLEQYLTGLTNVYDPHSVWFKPVSKENFDIDMHDSLTGIGAVLNMDEGYTTIKELVVGGPAADCGELKAGDKILAVAQGKGEPVDVVDMRLDKVVGMIRGSEGSTVVLTVLPADAADPSVRKLVPIVREKVKLAKQSSKGEVHEVDGVKVGVINVPSFYADTDARRAGDPNWASTARDTAKILTDFHTQGVQAVVVDLRMNGGGALDQAIELTGLFLKTGPVVQIRDRRGAVEVLDDEDPSVYWDGPLVVLTSEASASASEIFAAAIQDHHRGIVVGSKTTHGKGTVQNLLSLDRYLGRAGHPEFADDAGAIKFTTHKFYRVNGDSTQIKGVAADVVLPSMWEGMKIKESDLEHALAWDNIAPALQDRNQLHVDVAALQVASDARVKSSMGFAFMAEDVRERTAAEAKKTMSLYEPTRKAELDRLQKIKDTRDVAWKAAGADPESPPDFVLDEAMHVTHDMVRQLRG